MKNILTFGGSNSRKSINKSLAVYAAGLIENAELTIADFSLPSFYNNFTSEGIKNPALSLELQEKVQTFESSLNKFEYENAVDN